MMGIATGRYTFIRGKETTDEYGDPVNDEAIAHSYVQGSIIEKTRRDYNPDSGRIATQVVYTGRFAHGTDLQDGDRIKDENTGRIYLVNAVGTGSALVGKADVIADLSATS